MKENQNLFIAVILSALVLFGWEYFIARPQMEKEQAARQYAAHQHEVPKKPVAVEAPPPVGAGTLTRNDVVGRSGARVAIETPSVDGTLLLKGARLDDLRLRKYRETTNPKSPEIVLFSPEGTAYPYYAVFGWIAAPGSGVVVPDDNSVWTLASGTKLTPATPITLRWDNGHGLVFTRTISVDKDYMFVMHDTVANHGRTRVTLYPYAYVVRDGVPKTQHFWALHEGYVGVLDGSLHDPGYDEFKDDKPPETLQSTGGWLGITDKYWMAAIIPPQNQNFDGTYQATPLGSVKAYQANYRLGADTVWPGATASVDHRLFAGAKVVQLIQSYEDKDKITRFHMAIDWGWFPFFTQPIFYGLDYLSRFMNMGLAIMLLTVGIKLVFFPLADASYRSMSRMKKLQPEMERIKQRFADDQAKQQQEILALYQREKINPVSGCLPMLIQIPVFFSLYKVLLGTIEMRQAPFFGWIHDLSAPDPTSYLNLFGLLPFDPHAFLPTTLAFLSVGVWPIFMGLTQWLQQKLNPPATDPVQQRMFTFMPLIFTFLLAGLPSGLVIYWTWNNLLSVAQQYVMMRRQGVKVNILENMRLPGLPSRAETPPGE